MSSSVPGPEITSTSIAPAQNSNSISSRTQGSPKSELASPSLAQLGSPSTQATATTQDDMAAVVALPTGTLNKRYRPTPAKTFQCRGYGECRMVFSRSEHLARHIRKHTGERPFTCHCGKQFSRLDNLRQHAQTVHADKQDQNERMMRDLTTLHASMAAANKATGRGSRGRQASSQIKTDDTGGGGGLGRPGTSTGYEGWDQGQDVDMDSPTHTQSPTSAGPTQSFRDPQQRSFQSFRSQSGQSFRASDIASVNSLSNNSNAAGTSTGGEQFRASSGSTQSFRASEQPLSSSQSQQFSSARPVVEQSQFQFNVPPSSSFPHSHRESTSSRPSTSNTQLPPLSSVVPASLASLPPAPSLSRPSTGSKPEYLHGLGPAFPPPPGSSSGVSGSHVGLGERPASGRLLQFPLPASSSSHESSNARVLGSSSGIGLGGFGLGTSGTGGYRPGTAPSSFNFAYRPFTGGGSSAAAAAESLGAEGDSPFSFNPPSNQYASQSNERKRKFEDDERGDGERDRPQSRRLSVMELCDDGEPGPLPASRPTTTSGITRGAAGLYIGVQSDDEETAGGPDEESRERSNAYIIFFFLRAATFKLQLKHLAVILLIQPIPPSHPTHPAHHPSLPHTQQQPHSHSAHNSPIHAQFPQHRHQSVPVDMRAGPGQYDLAAMDPMRSNSLGIQGHGYQGAPYRQSGLQYHRQPQSHLHIGDAGVGATNGAGAGAFEEFDFVEFMGPGMGMNGVNGAGMNGGLDGVVKFEGGSPILGDMC
ncbi:Up in starvation [Marasmius tenuissimus]|uniref:Up in starvation n=1 Tax=Marasmius tenuissimus TaxID=585030 RepID=A0ABR2ZXC2_9AGAR